MTRPQLEVCIATYAEAVIAQDAGADRVELNSALQLGGLTPSPATVQRILAGCSIEVIAMCRPRPGGFCYNDDHWATLLADCRWMIEQGVHGIAFGCLTPERNIDAARVRQMRERVGGQQLVFHRAFDLVEDWQSALECLIEAGVDRVMTSGGAESVPNGLQQIHRIVEFASGRIEIIPAGGITPENLTEVLRSTGCQQIHGTFSSSVPDLGYDDAPIRFSPVDQTRAVCPQLLERANAQLRDYFR